MMGEMEVDHRTEQGDLIMSTMTLTSPVLSVDYPVAPPAPRITPEELAAMSDGDSYELVDGHLRERNASKLSSFVGARMIRFLGNHCYPAGLGWVFGSDLGYRCFPSRPDHVRKPDASFVSRERMPAGEIGEGYCLIAPDLIVEVVSPNDNAIELEQKLREYHEIGVPLVWVIYPETRSARVHRVTKQDTYLLADGYLEGETVLPGFRIALADLFPVEVEAEPPALAPGEEKTSS
jgi:Uma2 family endonuclease